MPTKLLSLYLRLGAGAARLAFRVTERVVMVAGSAIGVSGRDRAEARSEPPADPVAAETAASMQQPPVVDQSAIDYQAEPATPLDRAEELAKTVDDEPDLVEEVADPGAEDGAGPTVEVDEPWEDYAGMQADAVIARLHEANAAELAVVELYERAHRGRKTVLAAAERRHREISGPAAS
jgi:hypothetical protein